MILRRLMGCLEVLGIAVLALVLGTFAASTFMRHVDRPASPPAGTGTTDTPPPGVRARIRVEVRNGAGLPGAAERMTELLRRRGFDVVDFGNAERFDHPRTHVLDRVGNPVLAREVASVLPGVPIRSAPDSALYLDVTVMIGHDLEAVLERADPESAEPAGWRRRIERALDRVRDGLPWLDRLRGAGEGD